MDPNLIPFGWGLFEEGDQVLTVEKGNGRVLYKIFDKVKYEYKLFFFFKKVPIEHFPREDDFL